MTRSELQDYGEHEPIWGFIAQLGRERFTGQADVGVDLRVELFATEGRVYFAQKPDDPPLGARFVATGVLTTEQLRNGSVKVGDTVSLARLFTRVPTIDRDAVELMADRFTQQVLETVAHQPVGPVALHPFRHHPSGMQQWYRDAEPDEAAETTPSMDALVADVVAQVSGEVPVVVAETVPEPVAEVVPEPVAETVLEPVVLEPVVAEPVVAEEPTPATEEPEPAPPSMTFEPLVTVPAEPEAALPTLSTLSGLTPLPTLGEVGTRMPTPAMVHSPAPMAMDDLPSLGRVGVSFHPSAVPDPTIEELEAMVEAPSAIPPGDLPSTPAALQTPPAAPVVQVIPAATLEPGTPLPPPVMSTGPSALDATAFGAMMAPAAPAAQETEQIWDMVDDLLGLPHPDSAAANGAAHESEKKGRGWLRGKRG
jgi:hypothetical protein